MSWAYLKCNHNKKPKEGHCLDCAIQQQERSAEMSKKDMQMHLEKAMIFKKIKENTK